MLEFWFKTASEFEQPNITFKNKLYADLLLYDSVSNTQQSFQTSTMKAINDVSQEPIAPLILMAFGDDDNNDGLVDMWNITVGLRLPQNKRLRGLNLIGAF